MNKLMCALLCALSLSGWACGAEGEGEPAPHLPTGERLPGGGAAAGGRSSAPPPPSPTESGGGGGGGASAPASQPSSRPF
jgi:hypothetical protein